MLKKSQHILLHFSHKKYMWLLTYFTHKKYIKWFINKSFVICIENYTFKLKKKSTIKGTILISNEYKWNSIHEN